MIGTAFSVLIRLELSSPGVQYLQGDHQLFNVIISAHAFIMIFFMVIDPRNKIFTTIINMQSRQSLANLAQHSKAKDIIILLGPLAPSFTSFEGPHSYGGEYGNGIHKWGTGYPLPSPIAGALAHSVLGRAPLLMQGLISQCRRSRRAHCKGRAKKEQHKYTKIFIPNAFFNRDKIASLAKKATGVYIFKSSTGSCYIGSSISLYNRVCSYFMPSILAKGDRRVLRYFHKYGFKDVSLTLYIMEDGATSEMAVELEQYFINTLAPDLNVDLVASSTGYHEPMSLKWREYLREIRGTPVYVYDNASSNLIHMFDSKTYLYKMLNMDHRTLDKYLASGKPFLNRFVFSLTAITKFSVDALLTIEDLQLLFSQERANRNSSKNARSQSILTENIKNPKLSAKFSSLNACAKALKADRATLRLYLRGKSKKSYFRGQ